jgi:putative transposase
MSYDELNWKEARRYRAVELHESGWSAEQIAEALDAGVSTVFEWVKKAREKGLDALRRSYKKRDEKLSPSQWDELVDLLEQGALANGFATDCWSLPRIACLIQRHFSVSYHPAYLSRLMRSKGWSYQRPKKRDRRSNPEECANWVEQTLPELKKKSGH